jgi:phage shock protein A
MTEPLTKRVGRIISGSLNAMIDGVENAAPETVMEQALREMDAVIEEVRLELGKAVANRHLASKRLAEKGKTHDDLQEKIALAVAEKRDDLAEAAIAQQLDIEAQIPVLEHAITETGEREKELESYIAALQAKQREMRTELQHLRQTRQDSAAPQAVVADNSRHSKARVDQALASFDRVLERQTGIAGNTVFSAQNQGKLAELETLARQNRIQERLAAVKSGK